MIKGAVKSKTMWASTLMSLSGAVVANMPFVQQFLTAEIYGWIMFGGGVLFAVLRTVTTKSLNEK